MNFAPDCGGFLACVDVKLVQPYRLEDISDSPALVCTIGRYDIKLFSMPVKDGTNVEFLLKF